MPSWRIRLGRREVPYAIGFGILVGVGAFFLVGGFPAEPHSVEALLGGVMGGFSIASFWIAGSRKATTARKVPKVSARKIPKQ